jgi:hypothetical protein
LQFTGSIVTTVVPLTRLNPDTSISTVRKARQMAICKAMPCVYPSFAKLHGNALKSADSIGLQAWGA